MDSKPEMMHMDSSSGKADSTLEHGSPTGAQVAHGEHVHVSEEDDRRLCRKTDWNLMPVLIWVYLLQILDKQVISYSVVFGLKENAGLVGDQYSWIGSIGYFAQLVAQPLGAFVLVKYSPRHIMPLIVICWGAALTGMSGAKNFAGLAATRFLLGWFEALALPLFSLMTVTWYRRAEQPMRVASWYASNGYGAIVGSAIVYGLGHVNSAALYPYQLIFLINGLITVITGVVIYWFIPHSVATARFLSPEDRIKNQERLRSNNIHSEGNTEFKWAHIFELFTELKTLGWIAMALCTNMGASVVSIFGPLILQGLAGFDGYTTTLLNIPFGALQVVLIYGASYAATRFRLKAPIFMIIMLPVIIGCALMYSLDRTPANKGPLLLGYYFLAFIFAANPLIVAWMSANTAGNTKKSALYTTYNAASAVGNIIGPQLYKASTAPTYRPGLQATMAFFCALEGIIALQVVLLMALNKRKERQRVKNGKPAKLVDLSMSRKFDNSEVTDSKEGAQLGQNILLDQTDAQNDEFQYVL